jgi:hypothetical protein
MTQMVMLDAGSNRPVIVPPEVPTKAEETGLKHLKQAIEAQQGDGRIYPANVTGNWMFEILERVFVLI